MTSNDPWQVALAGSAREDTYHRSYARIPTAFRAALAIRARMAGNPLPAWLASGDPGEVQHHYPAALHEISRLRPIAEGALGALANALSRAQVLFANRDCRAPAREDLLTGLLRGCLSEAIDLGRTPLPGQVWLGEHETRRVGEEPWQVEDYTPSPHQIHMYSVDLTVLGREARTGGDLAFVLDVGRPGAPAIAAICLQAKRANLLSEQPVDVSRKNKSYPRGEGQLGALAAFGKLGCAVAYLVYDNHERRALGEPSVPMVKDRTHLSEQETKKLRLDLRTDTVDFAHYLLDIAHRRSRGAFSGTGDPRFAPMLGRLLAGDLDHVVALSPDPEFGARLNRLLAIGNGGPFHPPFHFSWASPGPLDPDAVFKHNVFAD